MRPGRFSCSIQEPTGSRRRGGAHPKLAATEAVTGRSNCHARLGSVWKKGSIFKVTVDFGGNDASSGVVGSYISRADSERFSAGRLARLDRRSQIGLQGLGPA